MNKQEKLLLCEKHKNLIEIIHFFSNYMTQQQLIKIARYFSYHSDTAIKNALLELESANIIKKVHFEGLNMLILKSFALAYLQNDLNNNNRASATLPARAATVYDKICKAELFYKQLKFYDKRDLEFKDLKKLAFDNLHTTIFIKEKELIRYIRTLYKRHEEYFYLDNLLDVYTCTAQSLAKKHKNLIRKSNNKELDLINKIAKKSATYKKELDLFSSLGRNTYIESIYFSRNHYKEHVLEVNVVYTATNLSAFSSLIKKFSSIKNIFEYMTSKNTKLIINFTIVSVSALQEERVWKHITTYTNSFNNRNKHKILNIRAENNNVKKKYLFKCISIK